MTLSGLTYTDLAERYNVNLCTGGCIFDRSAHSRGMVQSKALHWRERRMQRRGLYRFLKLVALYHHETDPSYSEAQNVWLKNMFAYKTALNDLGIRFPRSFSLEDRARVRFLLKDSQYRPNRRLHDWAAVG